MISQNIKNSNSAVFVAPKLRPRSDGAGWIKKLKVGYFPQAVGVLDIWHLEGEFKKALGEERSQIVQRLKSPALAGKVEEIVDVLLGEVSGERMKSERILRY